MAALDQDGVTLVRFSSDFRIVTFVDLTAANKISQLLIKPYYDESNIVLCV